MANKNIITELYEQSRVNGASGYQSANWYMSYVHNLNSVNRARIVSEGKKTGKKTSSRVSNILDNIGHMWIFKYTAKHKETLPYYDTYPLIILLDVYSDGFLGCNLHYLPIRMRVQFFNALLKVRSDKKMDDDTRMKVTYSILKNTTSLKYYKPCIKRYLYSHMRSKMRHIPANEWRVAVYLPTQSFIGEPQSVVWNDSRATVDKGKRHKKKKPKKSLVDRSKIAKGISEPTKSTVKKKKKVGKAVTHNAAPRKKSTTTRKKKSSPVVRRKKKVSPVTRRKKK